MELRERDSELPHAGWPADAQLRNLRSSKASPGQNHLRGSAREHWTSRDRGSLAGLSPWAIRRKQAITDRATAYSFGTLFFAASPIYLLMIFSIVIRRVRAGRWPRPLPLKWGSYQYDDYVAIEYFSLLVCLNGIG